MNLLQRILKCDEEEIDEVVKEAIDNANIKTKSLKIGFLNNNKANSIYKGFINLDTRIKYDSRAVEDYSMNTIDYFYEFARFARKYNINSISSVVYNLEYFINSYFGYKGTTDRTEIFNDIAWKTTDTDEEYFAALDNNKIGDLKGKNAAMCTERSALAQQILSILGMETYYCMGCIDLEGKQEAHAFNIVKRKNDYAILDYSMSVYETCKDGGIRYFPFVGILSNDEFNTFILEGSIKLFNNYFYNKERKREELSTKRVYAVGKYTIEKEEIDNWKVDVGLNERSI